MGAFNRPRYEAMARGVAMGKSIFQAAVDAGYGKKSRLCYKHSRRNDWTSEVEGWKLELQRGGSNELGPVITELMAGAERAMGLGIWGRHDGRRPHAGRSGQTQAGDARQI